MSMPFHKYRSSRSVGHADAGSGVHLDLRRVVLPDRQWPEREIVAAPVWCSVDLRDGNQALVDPMDAHRKQRMWAQLVAMGFREIEVGFPAASAIERDFVRWLIEGDRIPEEVAIQVLTQAREPLIRSTFESLRGARRVIVHLYNSTSELQRRLVFGADRAGIVEIAVRGAEQIAELAARMPETEFVFQYSPESFTGTELDFALEICDAVSDVWEPTPAHKMIVNLPATVEVTTPNVYADRIEWMSRHLTRRDSILLSVHPHNDRGCAVAAAELALLAGAERVEGTLLGNGERTGNVDLVTLALNLVSQGVDPGLDVSDVNAIARVTEECNRLPVSPRHPYVGELVFTAFSGSHQDAIKKGLAARAEALERVAEGREVLWEVPYLPIDPADVGRLYEPVVRINSQSGKGGVAFVLEQEQGLELPRRLQIEFADVVQHVADERAAEIGSGELWQLFRSEYLLPTRPVELVSHQCRREPEDPADEEKGVELCARVRVDGKCRDLRGAGSGPLEAFGSALRSELGAELRVVDFREHALRAGADAEAVAFVEIEAEGGGTLFGVGIHTDIATASLRALVSAVNRRAARSGSLGPLRPEEA